MREYLVKVHSDDTEEWYLDNKRHREDGPAIDCANGDKIWYLNDKLHREDGPAIEYVSRKEWYLNGKRHREDGPAIEYTFGYKEWFLDDIKLSEEEFLRQRKDKCDGKIVEVDGKKYELRLVKEEERQ
ncbi:MAG: hypothetical protein ACXABD_15370 [Candidatus Thorarchaeota archaeon]|jgi:hypothetical protein